MFLSLILASNNNFVNKSGIKNERYNKFTCLVSEKLVKNKYIPSNGITTDIIDNKITNRYNKLYFKVFIIKSFRLFLL